MRRTKMLHILEMLIVCGVGLTLILYPEKSWAYATKILAIALLAGGVIALLYYLIIRKRGKADKSMVLIAIFGVIAIIGGIIIFVWPTIFDRLFQFAAAILVAFSGILNLLKAFDVKREGRKGWGVLLLMSILAIGLGVLIFINPFNAQAALVIMVGAALIYNGVLGIIAAAQE